MLLGGVGKPSAFLISRAPSIRQYFAGKKPISLKTKKSTSAPHMPLKVSQPLSQGLTTCDCVRLGATNNRLFAVFAVSH